MLEYDYKKNLEHLKERYENKINTLYDEYGITDGEEFFYNDGLIEGLETVIHDIGDILNGLEM